MDCFAHRVILCGILVLAHFFRAAIMLQSCVSRSNDRSGVVHNAQSHGGPQCMTISDCLKCHMTGCVALLRALIPFHFPPAPLRVKLASSVSFTSAITGFVGLTLSPARCTR